MKLNSVYLGLFVFIVLFGCLRANLRPIVSPTESDCNFHGDYIEGICSCNGGYTGIVCQYEISKVETRECKRSNDCYDCEEYDCPLAYQQQLNVCDYVVKEEYKVNGFCRNITAVCFPTYSCTCPEGISLLGSDCFRTELLDRFGFFMIVIAALTVFSIGFELVVHFLEHFLAHHHQKGLLGIVQGFKSELTLIGLIGLTLFIVNSNGGFEHLIEALQGSEEVIDGVHFLMFFFVIVYFFVLIFSLIVMKVLVSRRFKQFELVHAETFQALLEGRDHKQRAREVIVQVGANSQWSRRSYANYCTFRKFFFASARTKFSREELAFFPFNEYMNLCLSDVMGRISSGTWIIWIAFAFFFFMDVYLKDYYGYTISRIAVMVLLSVTNVFIVIPKIRMAAFSSVKPKALNINEENVELLHENPQEVRLAKAYQRFFACGRPKVLEILTQIALWFSILNAFAVVFMNDASLIPLLIAICLALLNGSYIITILAPMLAGILHNGPKLNVQFVKEVLKRHPQNDKLQIYRAYVAQKQNARAPGAQVVDQEELQDVGQE